MSQAEIQVNKHYQGPNHDRILKEKYTSELCFKLKYFNLHPKSKFPSEFYPEFLLPHD